MQVNFYAHMVSACWQSREPRYLLGAMLPDFATIARVRLPEQADELLRQGVDFHHESDRLFHRLPGFLREERQVFSELSALGLRRGPSRGIAHVGVELCMDGALVGEVELDHLFKEAMRSGLERLPSSHSTEDGDSLRALFERILAFGPPLGYRDPSIVSDRLLRILEPRPLLRPTESEAKQLRKALPDIHERVTSATPAIMAALRALV